MEIDLEEKKESRQQIRNRECTRDLLARLHDYHAEMAQGLEYPHQEVIAEVIIDEDDDEEVLAPVLAPIPDAMMVWALEMHPDSFVSFSQIDAIQRATLKEFPGITMIDLKSARRTQNCVQPRQLAMYLAKTRTLKSLPEIGRRFGGRDHTTVLHAVRKIERLIPTDPELAARVKRICKALDERP